MDNEVSVVNVNGEDCLAIKDAAKLSHRTEQAVRMLLVHGNRLGKLSHVKLGYSVMIPVKDFLTYKFTKSGRGKEAYMYDLEGNEKMEIIE